MKKITRLRVTDRMVRVIRYIRDHGPKSTGELHQSTGGAFPSMDATSMCLWNMAKLGLLGRLRRVNGNGLVRFKLSDNMFRAIDGQQVDDRRIMEAARKLKELDERRSNGG